MKITASEKGIEASGKIRGQKGNAGISEDGIVELGLDIKVAEIGISTDYGGSIIVGFAGQKIVWGLEGGRLLIKFGGIFEVEVEARDCVVTETKKIAGQIVASRTYPDPGCKLPEPPEPAPTQPNLPPPQGDGTEQLGEGIAWVFVNGQMDHSFLFDVQYYPGIFLVSTSSQTITVEGPEELVDGKLDLSKCIANNQYKSSKVLVSGEAPKSWYDQGVFGSRVTKSTCLNSSSLWVFPPGGGYARMYTFNDCATTSDEREPSHFSGTGGTGTQGVILHGEQSVIKAYILKYNSDQVKQRNYSTEILQVSKVLPRKVLPRKVLPSAGNRPPMPQDCCESLKADIEDIKTVLATKEMLAKKLTFPWRTRIAGGTGNEIIEDYPNLLRAIAQQIDHLGIHPPKLSVKDLNNAIAGDQGLENQFPSATQGFEALMAQIWDVNGDVDTLTNFLYRLSWLCVQQSMNLARLSGDIKAIKEMCGGECEPVEATLTTPFNISAGTENSTRGKGFAKKGGDKIDNRIDLNTEKATEELLPDFLRVRDNNLVIERFSGNKDIFDLLAIIILKLEKLNS